MKKQISLLLCILITLSSSAQNKIFPAISGAQHQQLLNTKIAAPLPTWLPDGFIVTSVVTKTGKGIKLENKILSVTYSKKINSTSSLKFEIEAGFEGLGDLPYEDGETVKSKLGNIYLYYEPFDEDMNGKKIKSYGFIMTEWFIVNHLSFHVSFNSQNPNEKPDSKKPKMSKEDVKKILQSMEVLK